MRFEKTTGDLNIICRLSPQDIGLYEVLDVMLDLLLDIRQETGKELSGLPVTGDAAAKWVAVANALRSIPIDSEALALTRRRREKLPMLKKELAEKEAGVQKTERETEEVREEEERLKKKLAEYRSRCEELDILKGSVSEIKQEIAALEASLSASESIDLDAVKERRDQLLKAKNDSQKRIAVYNEYTAQLADALAALEQIKSDVTSVSGKIAAAKAERESSEQELFRKREELQLTLAENREALQQTQAENDRRAADADAEIEKMNNLIAQQEGRCAEKREELQKLGETLAEQEEKAAALDVEIDSLLAEVKTQENSRKGKQLQAEALAEEIKQAKEQADQMEQEFLSLTDRNKDAAWQISALKSRKADFDKEYEDLLKSKTELEFTIGLKQDDINACRAALSKKKLESKQKEEELCGAKEELAAVEEQLSNAETAISRTRVTLETMKNNLADVNKRIAAAGKEESDLASELNARREELKQKLAGKDEAAKKLNAEVTEITERYSVCEKEYLSLSERHNALAARVEQLRSESETMKKSIEKMRADEEMEELRKENFETEKARMEQNLSDYRQAIAIYESFFDSEECRETQAQIDRMERIVALYQDGVQSLFGSAAPPVEHLGTLQYRFDEMRRKLRDQVKQVQALLNSLSKDYLSLIAGIEREVKL